MIDPVKKTCLVILAIAFAGIVAFRCPHIERCNCLLNHENIFELYCPIGFQVGFSLAFRPDDFVKIECIDRATWSDLPTLGQIFRNLVETLYVRGCDFPSNSSIKEATRSLGVAGYTRLVFHSYKNSTKLRRYHLRGLENLQHLILSGSGLSHVDHDLLNGLPQLTVLNLRENRLDLSPGFFQNGSELVRLELGGNRLRAIVPGLFVGLVNLSFLSMWKNRLTALRRDEFAGLKALRILDLNMNLIADLTADALAELKSLEYINLCHNNLTMLPAGLFRHNHRLRIVSMFENRRALTTLPGGFFGNLTRLGAVRLKGNGITQLPEDLFWGSYALANVSLRRNRLISLPAKLFRDSVQLTKLDLSSNELKDLPDHLFSPAEQLIKLDLSRNRVVSIRSNTFNGLISLEILNLRQNHLTTISDRSFMSLQQLRIAQFSDNELTLEPPYLLNLDFHRTLSPFYECKVLQELYLANNRIRRLFSDWIIGSPNLRVLDLNNNNISYMSSEDLFFKSNDLTVDLTHNNIRHILLNDVGRFAMPPESPRNVIVMMGSNPLVCDCELYEFLRYAEGKMHSDVERHFRIATGNFTCSSPTQPENANATGHRSDSLMCTPVEPDEEIYCPAECECILAPEDGAFVIDCSYRELIGVPDDIGRINGSQWRIQLNLAGNELAQMPALKDLRLESVNELLLSYNSITTIHSDGLSDAIQILELHHNNISRIPADVLGFLGNSTNLTRITLHGNPWTCDCEAASLLSFVQSQYNRIPDRANITCRNDQRSMWRLTPEDLCPRKSNMILLSVTLAIAGLLITITGLYYKYSTYVKIWLFVHRWCLWLVTEEEREPAKRYDAFITYAYHDEGLVAGNLLPVLESEYSALNLCLHQQDCLAGEWLPILIARSVKKSRRTIIVLTRNFLRDIWGRLEFRAAHTRALSDGSARVILILYGDVKRNAERDPELRAYMRAHTYIRWGEPWFWDKVRFALPHPPKDRLRQEKVAARRNSMRERKPIMLPEPLARLSVDPEDDESFWEAMW